MVDPLSQSAEDLDTTVRFVELLEHIRPRLFGYIHAMVLNLDDAEDLYQQVVTVLWKDFEKYEPNKDFGRWAAGIAKLTIKDFVRRRRRSKVLFSDEVIDRIIEDHAASGSDRQVARQEALSHCLDLLPMSDRQLIEKCYGSGRMIRDVAGEEGRTPDAIYVTLHRIRRVLFNCIERTIRREVQV